MLFKHKLKGNEGVSHRDFLGRTFQAMRLKQENVCTLRGSSKPGRAGEDPVRVRVGRHEFEEEDKSMHALMRTQVPFYCFGNPFFSKGGP